MAQVSRPIYTPGVERIRVRKDGEKLSVFLIDDKGEVQMVPVEMEGAKPQVSKAA